MYRLGTRRGSLVSAGILGEENVLHIESTPTILGVNLDDFIIDNIVIWFKTTEADENGRPTVGVRSEGGSHVGLSTAARAEEDFRRARTVTVETPTVFRLHQGDATHFGCLVRG